MEMSLYGCEYQPPVPRMVRGPAEGLVLVCPGAAADPDRASHLLGPYTKRCRHGLQQRRIRNIPGLEGQPLLGTHAGQESDYLHGNATVLASFLHKDAEQLTPDPAGDLVELFLIVNLHTHIHLAPHQLRLSTKSERI